MADQGTEGILRRKLAAGRARLPEAGPTPLKALRAAMVHAGEDFSGLIATVSAVSETLVTLDDLIEQVAPRHLILRLDLAGGQAAMAMVEMSVVAAAIEQVTMGRVGTAPLPERRPTRTDAALVSELVLDFVRRQQEELARLSDGRPLPAVTATRMLEDGRQVAMALAHGQYRRLALSLDFGEGARAGQLVFFTLAGRANSGAAPVRDREISPEQWMQHWQQGLMRAPAELNAVLWRMRRPLAEVLQLKPGALIEVPRAALGAVSLEAQAGRRMLHARLGQAGAHKAVRVLAGPPPDMAALAGAVAIRPPGHAAAAASPASVPSTAPASVPMPSAMADPGETLAGPDPDGDPDANLGANPGAGPGDRLGAGADPAGVEAPVPPAV